MNCGNEGIIQNLGCNVLIMNWLYKNGSSQSQSFLWGSGFDIWNIEKIIWISKSTEFTYCLICRLLETNGIALNANAIKSFHGIEMCHQHVLISDKINSGGFSRIMKKMN